MAFKARIFLAVCFVSGLAVSAHAQNWRNALKSAEQKAQNYNGSGKSGAGLSQSDIAAGLKQALQVGAKNAIGKVGTVNGFFGDALIKILMPPEAKKVETTLRQIGLGDQVDNAILSMNRAAEDAAPKALDIFINAITSMTIQDGLAILQGKNDAATQYLKAKTSAQLTAAFRPVIQQSLDKVNATKYWAIVFKSYNEVPFTEKVNTDLPAYVTENALKGVFVYIAQEEAKIRTNPAARVTDLLKKVFGGK